MLAILGIIAMKTQGLVGNEFVDTGVDPRSDGAPTTEMSAQGTAARGIDGSQQPKQPRGTYKITKPVFRSQNIE